MVKLPLLVLLQVNVCAKVKTFVSATIYSYIVTFS